MPNVTVARETNSYYNGYDHSRKGNLTRSCISEDVTTDTAPQKTGAVPIQVSLVKQSTWLMGKKGQ